MYETPQSQIVGSDSLGLPRMSLYDHWRYSTRPGSPANSSDTVPTPVPGVIYRWASPAGSASLTNTSASLRSMSTAASSSTSTATTATPRAHVQPRRFDLRELLTPMQGTPGPDPLANWNTPQLNSIEARGIIVKGKRGGKANGSRA